eukprot:88767_1
MTSSEETKTSDSMLNPLASDFVPQSTRYLSQSSINSFCVSNDISKCKYLKRLITVISEPKIDQNISTTLDDYLHTIDQHGNDKDFEYIFAHIPFCDLKSCLMFKQNRRDKNTISCAKDRAHADLMSKIHCYFYHSFDIGHRLSIKEKNMIVQIMHESKDNINSFNRHTRVKKIKETLHPKRIIHDDRINKRYNHMVFESCNDEKDENMYSFGFLFNYGYYGERDDSLWHEGINVSAKYSDLKTELTCNKISRLTIEQFNNEYNKALIHYKSRYCKLHMKPCKIYSSSENSRDYFFVMDHLISLMVYANYTGLQYEFSKTYRMDKGMKHTEFYWFGKYLKIAVHKFGTIIATGSINKFYHGITKPLLFPTYIAPINAFHCPLSTTSSIEVATNFALLNQGLVVQFEGGCNKYFSTAWLSDYGNEKEHLFVQNSNDLNMTNIIDTRNGIHYEPIFNILKMIYEMIWPTGGDGDREFSEQITDLTVITLVKCIISHQLSYKMPKFQSFESLQEYGRKMLNIFFKNREELHINDKKLKEDCSFLLDLLYHSDSQRINIQTLNVLFPNLQSLLFINMNLSKSLLTDILQHINNKQHASKIGTITIERVENSTVSILDAL